MTPVRRRAFAMVVLLATTISGPAADKPDAKPNDPRREALLKAGYTAVPVVWSEGRPLVQVEVKGEKGKFLLDTGGHQPLLSMDLAKELKLDLGEGVQSVGPGGRSSGRVVQLDGLTIGGFDTRKHMNSFTAVATDLSDKGVGLSGVFCVNSLRAFAAVLDLPNSTLYLRPPLKTFWPKVAGKWLVTGWREDEKPRQLDAKSPPTLEFADDRLKITDGGNTREFAMHTIADDDVEQVFLFDPKQEGKPELEYTAAGLIKTAGGKMTACLALDLGKAKDLPAEFAAPKGSGFVLLELKDAAAERTPPEDPLRKLMGADEYTAVPLERGAQGERAVTARVGKEEFRLYVETAATITAVDTDKVKKGGGKVVGNIPLGKGKADVYRLPGMTVGKYDLRAGWAELDVMAADYAAMNEVLAENKLPTVYGAFGQTELRNGSAVLDLHADTLYLRPLMKSLGPKLEGKWVGVSSERDGKTTAHTAHDRPTLEFKDGRLVLAAGDTKLEKAFHAQDEGDGYRLGLFDPKRKPADADFGYDARGILRLTGGKLFLVVSTDPKKVNVEPPAFAAPKGSGMVLIQFERAK